MKKLSKITLAIGLFGTVLAAHAKEESTNVTATATVSSPARLIAKYTADAPLVTNNLKSRPIGTITLSGYQGTPVVSDLSLSDAKASGGFLGLKNDAGNELWAEAFINGKAIIVNGKGSKDTSKLPAETVNIELKTWGSQEKVPAGEYTDDVTITLSNL